MVRHRSGAVPKVRRGPSRRPPFSHTPRTMMRLVHFGGGGVLSICHTFVPVAARSLAGCCVVISSGTCSAHYCTMQDAAARVDSVCDSTCTQGKKKITHKLCAYIGWSDPSWVSHTRLSQRLPAFAMYVHGWARHAPSRSRQLKGRKIIKSDNSYGCKGIVAQMSKDAAAVF